MSPWAISGADNGRAAAQGPHAEGYGHLKGWHGPPPDPDETVSVLLSDVQVQATDVAIEHSRFWTSDPSPLDRMLSEPGPLDRFKAGTG